MRVSSFIVSILFTFTITLINKTSYAQKSKTDFVFTVKTDNPSGAGSNDSTYNIWTHSSETYNFDIDWDNDGVFDTLGLSNSISIHYDVPGTYSIRIKGLFPRFSFLGTDRSKLVSVDQWGNQVWTNMERGLVGCDSLISLPSDTPNLSLVTDMRYMFSSATSIVSGMSHWDVSNVTNMVGMFQSATAFNDSIGKWDISKVTDIEGMFRRASSFNGDIIAWNLSSVKSIEEMFEEATSFNQPIGSWDVSGITNMKEAFRGASTFNQDLNRWDVSSVIDMGTMFSAALQFNENISDWDVSSVTDMNAMFWGASEFNQDIGNWKVDSLITMHSMFNKASKFDQDISSWNVSSVSDMTLTFSEASEFNQNLSKWDISNVGGMFAVFSKTAMSVSNYDSILIAWQSKPHKMNVRFGAENLHYCHGDSARSLLIADGWAISGDTYDCTITDLEELAKHAPKFYAYPNPSSGIVSVTLEENISMPLSVFNNLGQEVLSINPSLNRLKLDLGHLDNGIYYIRCGKQVKKLVLQHQE